MSQSVEDFLRESTRGKYPSIKFTTLGQKVVGVIAETPRMVEGTTPEGQPQTSLVIPLIVREGSTAVTGPKGEETPLAPGETYSLWVKPGTNQARAIAEAVGEHGLQEGGVLADQHHAVGDQPKNPAHNRAKLHVAQYQPPGPPAVSANDLI